MSDASFRCKVLDNSRLRILTVHIQKDSFPEAIFAALDDVFDKGLHAVQIISIERVEPTD